MPLKSASCRDKGRRFQQEIRDLLIASFDISETDIKSTPMGSGGLDIWLAGAARALFPYGIEAKNTERLELWEAIKQCETNAAKEGLKPALAFRRNRSRAYVVLRLEDFLALQLSAVQRGEGAEKESESGEQSPEGIKQIAESAKTLK